MPAAALLAGVFDLGINLVVVFAVILGSGISPQAGWLELPLLLLLLAALTAGVSLLLSALYVRYRDTDQIWQVVSQMIFFLTPTFYVAANLSAEAAKALLLANPIACHPDPGAARGDRSERTERGRRSSATRFCSRCRSRSRWAPSSSAWPSSGARACGPRS